MASGLPYMDTVRCCDCLEGLKELPDGCIDLVVTDPPYAYSSTHGGGCFGSDNKKYHSELEPISHGFSVDVNEELLRVMKVPNIYIWCSRDQVRDTLDWWLDNADVGMDILTWHKTNPVPTCHNKYLSDTEYLLFFRGKGVKVRGTYETKRKFLVSSVNKADKDLYNHPTVKPYGMTRDLIVNSSDAGDVVLDPFAGSGTTLAAAKELGRHWIGYEISPVYAETANRRVSSVTVAEEPTEQRRGLECWA